MIGPRVMRGIDRMNAAFLLALGVMFGIVARNMTRLSSTALWPVLFSGVASSGGVLAIDRAVNGPFERAFPSGIRTARTPKPGRRRPLALPPGLPAGVAFGVVLAALGHDRAIRGLT